MEDVEDLILSRIIRIMAEPLNVNHAKLFEAWRIDPHVQGALNPDVFIGGLVSALRERDVLKARVTELERELEEEKIEMVNSSRAWLTCEVMFELAGGSPNGANSARKVQEWLANPSPEEGLTVEEALQGMAHETLNAPKLRADLDWTWRALRVERGDETAAPEGWYRDEEGWAKDYTKDIVGILSPITKSVGWRVGAWSRMAASRIKGIRGDSHCALAAMEACDAAYKTMTGGEGSQ